MKDEWLGRFRGGWTSKIHVCVDGHDRPLSLLVTAGQCDDVSQLGPVLDAITEPQFGPGRPKPPSRLRVDRVYGAWQYRQQVQRRGIQCICPERQDSRRYRRARSIRGGRPIAFDAEAYKGRNVVERGISRLTDFRAVATRYGKPDQNYLAGALLAPIIIWLPSGQSDRPLAAVDWIESPVLTDQNRATTISLCHPIKTLSRGMSTFIPLVRQVVGPGVSAAMFEAAGRTIAKYFDREFPGSAVRT